MKLIKSILWGLLGIVLLPIIVVYVIIYSIIKPKSELALAFKYELFEVLMLSIMCIALLLCGCATVRTEYVYVKPTIPEITPCVMPSTSVTREDFGVYYLNEELPNNVFCVEQTQALIEWKRRVESGNLD
jgi:hypothetical protein